jgi:hypothetical protein
MGGTTRRRRDRRMQVPNATESVTETPTTTGTAYGEFYRQARTPPDDPATLQRAIDLVLGFAGPTMTMDQVATKEALQALGAEERGIVRGGLRYLTRRSNRVPEKGPQDPAVRADLIRGAVGLPSKTKQAAQRAAEELNAGLKESIRRPNVRAAFETTSPYQKALDKQRIGRLMNWHFMDWLGDPDELAKEMAHYPLESVKK